ncbi:MAG: hypothetical protein AAGF31_12965 [Planctomycetota bacterium]
MIYGFEFRLSGVEALSRSEVNAILKEAWYLTGRRWRQQFLPLKWARGAKQRYNYTPRAGERRGGYPAPKSYTGRKLAFLGHTRALEFSGETRREALTRENISATRDKVVVRLPRKFNLRRPGSPVRMNEEIRRVRPEELASLRFFLTNHIRNRLRLSGEKKSRVIFGGQPAAAA